MDCQVGPEVGGSSRGGLYTNSRRSGSGGGTGTHSAGQGNGVFAQPQPRSTRGSARLSTGMTPSAAAAAAASAASSTHHLDADLPVLSAAELIDVVIGMSADEFDEEGTLSHDAFTKFAGSIDGIDDSGTWL